MIREGAVQLTEADGAFFNPNARLSRDFGVFTLKWEADRIGRPLRIMDLLCGGGARTARYLLETPVDQIWACDGSLPAVTQTADILAMNRAPADRVFLRQGMMHTICRELTTRGETFDWVDLDAFGSPAPLWHEAAPLVRDGGVLYVTATDMAALWGKYREPCLRRYGALSRPWECGDEIGARVLLAALQNDLGKMDRYGVPVFTLDQNFAIRIALRIHHGAERYPANHIGWLTRCHTCGTLRPAPLIPTPCTCAHCSGPVDLAGPLWTGPLWAKEWLAADDDAGLPDVDAMRSIMRHEADMPVGYYRLPDSAHRTAAPRQPRRDHLMQTIIDQGIRCSATHFDRAALRVDAPRPVLDACLHTLSMELCR